MAAPGLKECGQVGKLEIFVNAALVLAAVARFLELL